MTCAGPGAARLGAQAVTVSPAGDLLHVRATGFGFIKGAALGRLKDGRSLRFEFELSALTKAGAPAAATATQNFVLSYDLWEERFAVTQSGSPPRAISHLTLTAAEAWCLERLTLPLQAIRRVVGAANSQNASTANALPFWIRLAYRVLDDGPAPDATDGGFTLRGLIDRLSRRPSASELRDMIEAGPFRLPQM